MQSILFPFFKVCVALLVGLLVHLECIANTVGPGSASVFLEDLTSPELRARIANGATTVLVPIGGTEQNGPHMALGKHNVRVRYLSGQIALALGNAVVAPVLAYVPEGAVNPPVAHMRFSGTLSIPDAAFESVLEGIARSFRQHGFRDVVFLGDHGGYQKNVVHVATKLNREWSADPATRVHALTQYYQITQTEYIQALKARGFSPAEIGTHAGLADTALALAIDSALVRSEMLNPATRLDAAQGVSGDPRRATAAAGSVGVQLIIDTSVKSIQSATRMRSGR
ncbi:MAG: creatininase family protein [Rhodoferax sp.]|nr:creatininase family protein [Rhodoferax sp.]